MRNRTCRKAKVLGDFFPTDKVLGQAMRSQVRIPVETKDIPFVQAFPWTLCECGMLSALGCPLLFIDQKIYLAIFVNKS